MLLYRLLIDNYEEWNVLTQNLSQRNSDLKVPTINDTTTLHQFNCELSDLFTETQYYFGIARRNKDAIERIIDYVLKDHYLGQNEAARRAAGLQYARNYPVPLEAQQFFESESCNLFDVEDRINGYYYALDSILKSLNLKAGAKITSNSILNIERSLVPN